MDPIKTAIINLFRNVPVGNFLMVAYVIAKIKSMSPLFTEDEILRTIAGLVSESILEIREGEKDKLYKK